MTSIADQSWFAAPALRRVFTLLNADGGEVRVVGGAVRNSLMQLPAGDIDMATTLTPDVVTERAKSAHIRVIPTGIEHGTVTLLVDDTPFEVTTLRRDVETDGRHAQVAFGTDWAVDAGRRDLTINALYATADGTVVDLVGGLKDIETRTVRFIGDAGTRIEEDTLRILRFFRFFALYGAGRPDADGLRASARAKDKISTLSAERIWVETRKLLSAKDPGRALLWMRQAGVLTAVLPETEKWGIDTIPALIATEATLGWEVDPLLRLAAIVPPDGERLAQMSTRLKMSRGEAACLQTYANAPVVTDATADLVLDRLLYRNGAAGIVMRLRIALANARQSVGESESAMRKAGALQRLLDRALGWTQPQFPLSGADALANGVASGPRVGKLLAGLEQEWLDANFTMNREALLLRLSEKIDQAEA
ncbi:CCA tRNA nucleotidyltransferase [Rhizobium sp. CFBP 8762]|uniref:CCA tRNA nucleotidyltransferase n=1 Tax=Rhizobium sp. CFBP 8762 TaxID=2775279 RepID=UPI00177FDDE5|nr:CCA tRNA nucleotidyltransferase [Rhizobium sp. CFBP 8762]MBD8556493.1 CCA tRNA nucleotidyltransferase [Rhizobium sp. CFBP 8762]